MACTARGARMVAMTLSRPPEREQARTSRSNTGASAGLERDVGDDLQAARGDHGVHRLSDQQHLEGRRFLAPRGLVEPRDRKDLERPAEVEDLHVRED